MLENQRPARKWDMDCVRNQQANRQLTNIKTDKQTDRQTNDLTIGVSVPTPTLWDGPAAGGAAPEPRTALGNLVTEPWPGLWLIAVTPYDGVRFDQNQACTLRG